MRGRISFKIRAAAAALAWTLCAAAFAQQDGGANFRQTAARQDGEARRHGEARREFAAGNRRPLAADSPSFRAARSARSALPARKLAATSYSPVRVSARVKSQLPNSNAKREARLFRFLFKTGDRSRILSSVDEDVFLNGTFHHHAEILNRISCIVTDTAKDGSGECEATFMTTELSTQGGTGKHYSWGDEYNSVFRRSASGKYEIGDEYFMPVVRDVPLFPENAVSPGDRWTAEGHEAHDLRRTFDIQTPFKVPFTAEYQYTGDETDAATGKTLCVLDVRYRLYYESPAPASGSDTGALPAVTTGYSHQTIWWDNDRGLIDHYREEFRIVIETFYGDVITFQGTAHAETADVERMDTEENVRKITDAVNELGLRGVEITKGEKGLTISLENIQFLPDSSDLTDGEKAKLRHIAEILKKFDNDLLITGHCARRGTRQAQQQISEERAEAVAAYLESLRARRPDCIFTRGKGAEEPVASNGTEEGRARNRRVEITLIDK